MSEAQALARRFGEKPLGQLVSAASRADRLVLGAAAAGLLVAGAPLLRDGAWSSVGLLLVAAALGWVFLASQFGYTGAFRAWLARGDGSGLAAGLLVPAVAA